MAEFANPALWSEAPADGQVPVYDAASDRMVPTAIASIGSPLTVPQAHPSEVTQTSVDVATTAPTNTTPYGYAGSAQAAAILTQINALVTDVAAIIVELDALQTKLTTAGILD